MKTITGFRSGGAFAPGTAAAATRAGAVAAGAAGAAAAAVTTVGGVGVHTFANRQSSLP